MQVTKDNANEVIKLLRHGPECIVRPHLHEPISEGLKAYRYDNVPLYGQEFTRFAIVRGCSSCLQVLLDGNANVGNPYVDYTSVCSSKVVRCIVMCRDYLFLSSVLPLLVGSRTRTLVLQAILSTQEMYFDPCWH